MTPQDKSFVIRVVTCTLATVIVVTVMTLLVGLFSPAVDNKEIFAVLQPGFNTIIGAFVGALAVIKLGDQK